jgi:hypothetical protein
VREASNAWQAVIAKRLASINALIKARCAVRAVLTLEAL